MCLVVFVPLRAAWKSHFGSVNPIWPFSRPNSISLAVFPQFQTLSRLRRLFTPYLPIFLLFSSDLPSTAILLPSSGPFLFLIQRRIRAISLPVLYSPPLPLFSGPWAPDSSI